MQGFGNVGGVAALELVERGATVLAVSDVSGGIYAEDGLDIVALHEYIEEHGSLEGCDAGQRITNEELLELECDILVLAAREDQVTADNAANVRARMIAEGANGPTSLEADAILRCAASPSCRTSSRTRAASPCRTSSGCRISAGSSGRGTRSARSSSEKLSDAFDRVWDLAGRRGLSLRTAALVSGIREVARALEARGIFP